MLKYLQISGFKSFAHKTKLEFSPDVTAIVGPNGSGKSNLADCMRWVLGEQSLKNLRIKKSEDLIFGGSPQKPRSARAQVSLFLDNSNGRFPIDYSEVALERQAFRDGENQYLINDSRVRLMDLEEFLAKSRLSSRGYSVIHQDMADSLLRASNQERRGILEEAMGIKEFQLKKERSERKLAAAADNLVKVGSLIGEIAPHLKYLKRQVVQFEARKKLEEKLRDYQERFFCWRLKKLEDDKNSLFLEAEKAVSEKLSLEKELEGLNKKLREIERSRIKTDYFSCEKEIERLLEIRNNLQKELAKTEGRLEIEQSRFTLPVDVSYISEKLKEIYSALKNMAEIKEMAEMRKKASGVLEKIENLFAEIKKGRFLEKKKIFPENLKENQVKIKNQLEEIENQMSVLKEKIGNLSVSEQKEKELLLNIEREIQTIQIKLSQFRYREEEFSRKKQETGLGHERLLNEIAEAGFNQRELLTGEAVLEENLEIKIEDLKRKLAVLGGIDKEIIREFEETNKRHEFLSSQSGDLKKACASLGKVIVDLKDKIESRFREGFENINREFNRYFRVIFRGGKARLKASYEPSAVSYRPMDVDHKQIDTDSGIILTPTSALPLLEGEGEGGGGVIAKSGVEIQVELPGKKISNLSALSGGERALTSIALLFAIIASNPPPFVVLDEVDAALDEANSRRFGALLKELSKNTQFVVITHNRETMRQASVLYGVTMESGVSKLLSLKLGQ